MGSFRSSPISTLLPKATRSGLYPRKAQRLGMAQLLSNFLHCLTSHGEKVFWVFILRLLFKPASLFLPPCTTVKCPSLSSTPCPWGQAGSGTPPLQPLMAVQVQPHFPFMKYNRRSKRVCENRSLDDFQSYKTVETISLLLITSENFRSGAQKAPITWESKADLSLSWTPWGSTVKNLQALIFWYLDFLLSKHLFIVHLKNISNSLPFFPSLVSMTPGSLTQTVTQMAAF